MKTKLLSFLLLGLLCSVGNAWGDTFTYDFNGASPLSDWTIEKSKSDYVVDIQATGTLYQDLADPGSAYLKYGIVNNSGTIKLTTNDSYQNISNVTLKEICTDNSKPSITIRIVDEDGETVATILNAGGHKANFGNPGTKKWSSATSFDLATPVTGFLEIYLNAGSSGKYGGFDDIIITYTPAPTVAPSTPTFGPASESSVEAGSSITLSATGATTILYQWAASAIDGDGDWDGAETYSDSNKPEVPAYGSTNNVLSVKASNAIGITYGSATYTITAPQAATPTISPANGSTFAGASQEITLACATDDATIHYTLDGSTPTALSDTYDPEDKPVISSTTTIKAIAVKGGYVNSDVASATITKVIENVVASWNFTSWSSATQTGVLGDATNWHNKEKASSGLDFTEENQLGRSSNISLSNSTLKYGTTTIPETDGIKFTASTEDNKRVCLMFNLPSTSLGTYHGSKFIWLQSSSAKITIPSVPAGAIIEIGVESHNATDARYLTLSGVDGISQTQGASSGDAAKVYQICKWSIPSTGNIVLTPNKGLHIYYITVTANVETVPVTIGATGWATFSSSYALDFTNKTVKAYKVTGVDGSAVVEVTQVYKVPANTGLLISGTTDDIPVATGAMDDMSDNLMVAGDGSLVAASPTKYVLANQGEPAVLGFYKIASGIAVPYGKAYLDVTSLGTAPSVIRIVDEEHHATNIENVEANEKAIKFIENGRILIKKNGIVYDAVGRVVR